MSQLTVGKLAKECGMGVETIRFYERSGLLPKPQRLPSGYRIYNANTITHLRFIQQVKHLGFTLDETKEMLRLIARPDSNCETICERVRVKKTQVEEKIAQLTKISEILGRLENDCPGGKATLEECVMVQHFNNEEELPQSRR